MAHNSGSMFQINSYSHLLQAIKRFSYFGRSCLGLVRAGANGITGAGQLRKGAELTIITPLGRFHSKASVKKSNAAFIVNCFSDLSIKLIM
jgi:hypothetical protein